MKLSARQIIKMFLSRRQTVVNSALAQAVSKQGGFVLLPVVLAIALIASIAFLINNDSAMNVDDAGNMLEVVQVDNLVRAGLSHALWQAQNNNCSGNLTIPTTSFGKGSYSATVNSAAVTASYTFTPDRDTLIKELLPNENNGALATLSSKLAAGDSLRTLFHYDLGAIAAGSTVASATAWFFVIQNDTQGAVTLHSLTADWAENDATWNTIGNNFETTSSGVIPVQAIGGVWVAVNVTALAQSWVNDSTTNFGFMMKSAIADLESIFASREAGLAQQPYLEVTTSVGVVSPLSIATTATLTGSPSPANDITRTLTRTNVPAYQPVSTASLQPGPEGKDTLLIPGSKADNNTGAGVQMWVSSGGSNHRGLIEFNISSVPYGVKVLSATVELYDNGPDVTIDGVLGIYRITRDWIEGTGDQTGATPADGASWDAYDGVAAWSTPGGDYDTQLIASSPVPDMLARWHNFDVTSLVSGWVNGTYPNYGMLIKAVSGSLTKSHLSTSDETEVTERPKLTINYACECGVPCMAPQGSGTVLMVVINPTTLVPSDAAKKRLFESWGYTVEVIGENSNAAAYNNAIATTDVVYISETVNANQVGTNLVDAPIPVVNQRGSKNAVLLLSNNSTVNVGSSINITDTANYITKNFPLGSLKIYDGNMQQQSITGEAAGLQLLTDTGGLAALDQGALNKDGVASADRRVLLPLGRDANFNWNYLNNNGRLIVQRALQWGIVPSVPIAPGFYRDEFNSIDCDATISYAGSNGTLDWSAQSWIEVGEVTDPCGNGVKLKTDAGSNRSRITVVDKGIMREVDLTQFPSAWLHFDYRRVNFSSATDMINVDVSTDAGASWNTVAQLTGVANDLDYLNADIDISLYAGSNAIVRFEMLNTGANELSYIDNVQIDDNPATPPPVLPESLLLVVPDATPANLSTQDSNKKLLIESWGYTVNLIDDSAAPGVFNTAVANADVVYISGSVDDGVLDTKLVDVVIGVVNEKARLTDEFGFSANWGTKDEIALNIIDNSHYITTDFPIGLLPIHDTAQTTPNYSGTLAAGLISLGENEGNPSLATLDVGASLSGGGTATAAGRRVSLPWSGPTFDPYSLNAEGKSIMLRAIEWSSAVEAGGGGPSPTICHGTFRDEFNAISFAGNDGSLSWTGDWLESGDGAPSATKGKVTVEVDFGDNRLSTRDKNRMIEREANLAGAVTAILTFDYRRNRLDDSDDNIDLEVSKDGGATWETPPLQSFFGPDNDPSYVLATHDISSFISTNTRIRFKNAASLGKNDDVFFDNIQIECSP